MPEYHWIDEGVFTVEGLFSPAECDAYIAHSEAFGYGDAPITGMLGPVVDKDVRNNDRVMRDDPELAAELWRRAREYVPQTKAGRTAVGVNERLRFYRYDPGQQFNWHYDGYFERATGERSFITFMVYLNQGFTGGETSFGNPATARCSFQIVPRQGMALFFDHPLLHKGEPVVSGRKYVLRTDVMYAAPPSA